MQIAFVLPLIDFQKKEERLILSFFILQPLVLIRFENVTRFAFGEFFSEHDILIYEAYANLQRNFLPLSQSKVT